MAQTPVSVINNVYRRSVGSGQGRSCPLLERQGERQIILSNPFTEGFVSVEGSMLYDSWP